VIGLDTNVLVRFITQDDPRQSAIANEIFEERLTAAEPGFVSLVAMAEMVWVLERNYRLPDREIAAAIERVLQIETLVVENEQAVFTAMIALKNELGSFADALIGALGAAAGCRCTISFDRKALRLPGFEHPQRP
jgi:predicted nucleic-acid-binding protein